MIVEVKKHGFSMAEIGEMNDDQILFWYSSGRSVKAMSPRPTSSRTVAWDKSLTAAENFARFRRASEEREKQRGKDR